MNPLAARAAFGLGMGAMIAAAAGCRADGRNRTLLLAGGATTVFDITADAFSLPAPNLSAEHRSAFFVGNSFFNQNWVVAPASTEARDGLGPLFNARSCSGCHFKDGRGRPPEGHEAFESMLLRISVPGRGANGAPKPDPTYGDQIQTAAIPGVPREADARVQYGETRGTFPEGEPYSLRTPHYVLERFAYGPAGSPLLVSPRVAPAMIGLGLLEAVPEAALRALADPGDADGDGVSGRPNVVWDAARGTTAMGRFGWKAEQPTVMQQTAGAFLGDMGITSELFPRENHESTQTAAATQPGGGSPELSPKTLESVVLYAKTLGVPGRRASGDPAVARGETLFEEARCTSCHVPEVLTAEDAEPRELAAQTLHPYTDLLLHDLGEGLSDGRPAFEAEGREWRTAPLWGLGLVRRVNGHGTLLHDGRARNVTEAVLWHGGEAASAKERFRAMSVGDRRALVAFVESL